MFPGSTEVLVIRLYKLCDITSYTYNMQMYMGNGGHCMVQQQQPMYGDRTDEENRTQSQIICGQFFFPLWIFGDLTMKKWSYGTVGVNRKGMPDDLSARQWNWDGGIPVRTVEDLTSIQGMDKGGKAIYFVLCKQSGFVALLNMCTTVSGLFPTNCCLMQKFITVFINYSCFFTELSVKNTPFTMKNQERWT
jgi:hypothetical protein